MTNASGNRNRIQPVEGAVRNAQRNQKRFAILSSTMLIAFSSIIAMAGCTANAAQCGEAEQTSAVQEAKQAYSADDAASAYSRSDAVASSNAVAPQSAQETGDAPDSADMEAAKDQISQADPSDVTEFETTSADGSSKSVTVMSQEAQDDQGNAIQDTASSGLGDAELVVVE